jgi:hypothetical protein
MKDYMIILIQSPWISHSYRGLLTHGDGEQAHGWGDRVGDDGDEEALEIPLSGVESGILQTPKMKITMVAVLWTS